MARFTTLGPFTVGPIAASGSEEHNEAIPASVLNIGYIKIAPSVAGGTFTAVIYKRDTFLAADLCAGWSAVSGNLIDPIEDNAGTYTERNEQAYVAAYEDLDASNELHLKLTNNDAVEKSYTVTVDYEVPLGDVFGPAASVDNAICRFNGTSGKIIQDYTSGAPTIGDTGAVTFPGAVTINNTARINVNSATALVVEQDGVKDDVLVVDTANGRVGIGIAPSALLDVGSGGSNGEALRFSYAGAPSFYNYIFYQVSGSVDANNQLKFCLSTAAKAHVEVLTLDGAGNVTLGSEYWLKGLDAGGNSRTLIRARGAGYNTATYPGVQVGEESNHIALFIDPGSVAGGAFNGNQNELFLPNAVYFKQANAGATDWLDATLSLVNGKIVVGLSVYANNAAAVAGGLTAGMLYRTAGDPDAVCVVH